MSNFCQLWLTCADKKEANKIAYTLLEKHLVACVHQMPISSTFHWKGEIASTNEVLLQMESSFDLFDKVEAEVAKLHSYEAFVLEAVPALKVSKKAQAWLTEELNG